MCMSLCVCAGGAGKKQLERPCFSSTASFLRVTRGCWHTWLPIKTLLQIHIFCSAFCVRIPKYFKDVKVLLEAAVLF